MVIVTLSSEGGHRFHPWRSGQDAHDPPDRPVEVRAGCMCQWRGPEHRQFSPPPTNLGRAFRCEATDRMLRKDYEDHVREIVAPEWRMAAVRLWRETGVMGEEFLRYHCRYWQEGTTVDEAAEIAKRFDAVVVQATYHRSIFWVPMKWTEIVCG